MVVVESAVTSIYICYAEDPLLIHRWDAELFNQMSETLHQRLQYRSARVRQVLTQNRLDDHIQESIPVWIIYPCVYKTHNVFNFNLFAQIYERESLSVPFPFPFWYDFCFSSFFLPSTCGPAPRPFIGPATCRNMTSIRTIGRKVSNKNLYKSNKNH